MFNVTYEIVTEESAENGDCEDSGFILQGASLREAIAAVLETRTSHVSGRDAIEPSESGNSFRWLTIYNGMEYLSGAYESRALHIPEHITDASRGRILRLVRAS